MKKKIAISILLFCFIYGLIIEMRNLVLWIRSIIKAGLPSDFVNVMLFIGAIMLPILFLILITIFAKSLYNSFRSDDENERRRKNKEEKTRQRTELKIKKKQDEIEVLKEKLD